jgi:hypothetical protein
MATLLTQSVGRVCRGPYSLSAASRCSPLVCLYDTFLLVFDVICLRYGCGCSFRVATQHVWYNRFDKKSDTFDEDVKALIAKLQTSMPEIRPLLALAYRPLRLQTVHYGPPSIPASAETSVQPTATTTPLEDRYYPGSAMDRTWRYSIGAFLVGALPQTVKVFAMQGVPGTQFIVAIYLFAFLVPELFRVIVGPAGALELHALPFLSDAKQCWYLWTTLPHYLFCILSSYFTECTSFFYILRRTSSKAPLSLVTVSLIFSSIFTVLVAASWDHFTRSRSYDRWTPNVREEYGLVGLIGRRYDKVSSLLGNMFGLNTPSIFTGTGTILVLVLASLLSALLLQTSWDGYTMGSSRVLEILFQSFCAITIPFFIVMGLRLIYRVAFVGRFSYLPRRLTGINGTLDEFLSGCFLIYTFGSVFVAYAIKDWDPTHTYKPSWTEYLG